MRNLKIVLTRNKEDSSFIDCEFVKNNSTVRLSDLSNNVNKEMLLNLIPDADSNIVIIGKDYVALLIHYVKVLYKDFNLKVVNYANVNVEKEEISLFYIALNLFVNIKKLAKKELNTVNIKENDLILGYEVKGNLIASLREENKTIEIRLYCINEIFDYKKLCNTVEEYFLYSLIPFKVLKNENNEILMTCGFLNSENKINVLIKRSNNEEI